MSQNYVGLQLALRCIDLQEKITNNRKLAECAPSMEAAEHYTERAQRFAGQLKKANEMVNATVGAPTPIPAENFLMLRRENDGEYLTHGGHSPYRKFTLWLNRVKIDTFTEGGPPNYWTGDNFDSCVAKHVVLFERALACHAGFITGAETTKLPRTPFGFDGISKHILIERAKL